MRSYDHLIFSSASVVYFRASKYIIALNRTSESKVVAVWIFLVLPCSISSISIYYAPESHPRVKSYDHSKFSRASVVQLKVSLYLMGLNRTSEWKVMTIWISRELPQFIFERLNILCAWIGPSSEKLWPFEFLESFRCSISSVSIYYSPESDPRVKSYNHLNFSRASVVQFWGSRYSMRLNRTSELKVMTIWISQELPCSISSISICDAP